MFGERLRELRIQKKKTHQDIARELMISRQAYGFYENEKRSPDYETLKKLANYFKVSMAYLLGETDQKNFSSNIESLHDTVVTANPNVINIEDLSVIEKVFLQAYRQIDYDIRQKFIEHLIEALDTHRSEIAAQKNIDAELDETELDRYRLELEAELLAKKTVTSNKRKSNLG